MPAECSPPAMQFTRLDGRAVVADLGGGVMTSDATDNPLHGRQEGRFFHGYYDCYCYLPLYIFCGDHLLAAKLRRANIDASAGAAEEVARIVARIRERWPAVEIVLRAGSGFAREGLMAWCEANGVDYVCCSARWNDADRRDNLLSKRESEGSPLDA